PSVWLLAMVPVAVAVVVAGITSATALHFLLLPTGAWARAHVPSQLGFLATVAEIVVFALVVVTAIFVGFTLAQPLSGPALNRIVQRSEAPLGARTWPAASFVEDVLTALKSIAI